MFFKNKNKGAVSLFTGIAVLFVSIIFLGIFTYFAMGYFGGLEDSQRMKNNRNSLSLINEMLLEIKDSGSESYRAITLNTSDPITIDHNSSKITLTQEIKNQRSIERLKTETNIGALTINKRETSIVYTLDYNGQLLFYNTMDIMPVKQKIIFEKINEVNGIPVISISTEQLSFEGTKIYSPIENITYSLGEAIEFKGIVTNTLEDYNCEWVSNIDGVLTEQCNYVVEEISQGEHEITFTAKIEEEVIATKKINIIVGSTTVVPLFSINILTPSNNYSLDQGEEISFTSQVNNPVGSYSCAWSSSIDGGLSSDCNFSSSGLSVGSHTITLAVTDENETKTKNISLIVNQSVFTNVAILSPSQSSTHNFGDAISFSSEVNNPEGSYNCSWSSSIDGNLTTNNNPIGRWDFNETSGTTAYDLIGEVNGTMNNVTRTTDRFGRANNALSFNGSTSYVNLGNTLNSQLNYFTLSAWINPVSVANTRIIDTRGTGTGGLYKGFQFKAYQSGSNWSFHNSAIDDGAGNYIPCTSCGSENPLNQWYHVIMTRDSQNIKFYLNGELDGTVNTSSVGNIVNTLPLVIGSGVSANGVEGTISQQFNGKIDDVLIFDQAIDQEDVLKLYNNEYSLDNCDINVSNLSPGNHTITLAVNDSNQTLTTTRNITVANPTTIAILSPSQSSTHDFGDAISFSSEVNNPEGSYNCSWSSSIDGNLVPSKVPYAQWDFNESSGTTVYDVRNNINGIMNNVTRTTDRFGRANNALSFNGTTSYINLGSSNLITGDNLQKMTVSLWAKTTSTAAQYPIAIKRTDADSTLLSMSFNQNTSGGTASGYAGFLTRDFADTTHSYVSNLNNYNDGEWYHIVGTVDDLNRSLYINGEYISSDNQGMQNVSGNTANAIIGSFNTSTHMFNGQIDDIKIYRDTITSSDVLKLYNNEYSSNNCDINVYNLSPGSHTITLAVTDSNQTLTTTRNITVENIYLEATGGTITTSGDYKYHTFTSSGTFNVTTLGDGKVDVLVVGGGGGAGKAGTNTLRNPGGGGAGGLIYIEDYTISSTGNKSIAVGSGGTGATTQAATGNNGQNSVFENLTAYGGGGGGSRDNPYRAGTSGGSGGGANLYSTEPADGGSATQPSTNDGYSNSGFGNPGATSVVNVGAGGGGGAGGPGTVTSGGPGMSIWGNIYAKGGDAHSNASSGAANTGNGGNGSAVNLATNGGNGGSGIVIVRYKYQN